MYKKKEDVAIFQKHAFTNIAKLQKDVIGKEKDIT